MESTTKNFDAATGSITLTVAESVSVAPDPATVATAVFVTGPTTVVSTVFWKYQVSPASNWPLPLVSPKLDVPPIFSTGDGMKSSASVAVPLSSFTDGAASTELPVFFTE